MAEVIDLAAVTDWASVPIPGSQPPVRLHRLHVDPVSKASLSLVEFPAGWRRPGTGHYLCAEEFVVLGGELTVSGVAHGVGDHVYLPTRWPRVDSETQHGCRALAWFSAPPAWRPGEGPEPEEQCRVGPPRLADPGAQPTASGPRVSLYDQVPAVAPVDRDVLELSTSHWWFVAANEVARPATGQAFVRRWPPAVPPSDL